jgi:magnesium transporter
MRDETGLIEGRTKLFFRDCYDHTVIILDLLETFRDATRNLMGSLSFEPDDPD